MSALLHRMCMAGGATLIVVLSCEVVHAQAERPAARDAVNNPRLQRRLAQIADQFAQRQIDPLAAGRAAGGANAMTQAKRWLDQYGDRRLISSEDVNPVDQAHIKLAEIHLGRKEYQACMDQLQTIIDEAEGKENDAVWLARLNRANVARRHIGNMPEAIREYTLARGRWAAIALPLLLDYYDEFGQLDQAVDLLAKDYDPNDPGLKLGLLRIVAELHQARGDIDKSYQCYERITKEFTREEVEKFIADAASFGEAKRARVEEFADQGKGFEAEKVRKEAAGRAAVLRAQGRAEEADAVDKAMGVAPPADLIETIIADVPPGRPVQPRDVAPNVQPPAGRRQPQ